MLNIYYFSLAISLLFIVVIIHLIRRRRLKEQYSLMWLALGTVMMIVSVFPLFLEKTADFLDVSYPPSLLYMLGILGILSILLHLTLAISKLTGQNVTSAQTLAMHEARIQRLEALLHKGISEKRRNEGDVLPGLH